MLYPITFLNSLNHTFPNVLHQAIGQTIIFKIICSIDTIIKRFTTTSTTVKIILKITQNR